MEKVNAKRGKIGITNKKSVPFGMLTHILKKIKMLDESMAIQISPICVVKPPLFNEARSLQKDKNIKDVLGKLHSPCSGVFVAI